MLHQYLLQQTLPIAKFFLKLLTSVSFNLVPSIVWELNKPLPPEEGADVIDLNRPSDGPRWWETQPISRLILTSNLLTTLSGDGFIKLNTLTHLDVRDNRLSDLPNELGELVNLKALILSLNQLQKLPDSLGRLQSLVLLDVANNQLTSLGDHLADLTNLEKLDAFHNCLTSLPGLPPRLRKLDLNHNRIERLPHGLLQHMPLLNMLDVSSNQLTSLVLDTREPSARSDSDLTVVNAAYNRLTSVPDVAGLSALKELCLGDNRIAAISLSVFQGCSLTTLDLAHNGLSHLPEGLSVVLPNLVRLDVSANELTALPTELGIMRSLQVLMVERNPLRSIRQNVLAAGTNAIKEVLAQRHVPTASAPNTVSQPVASESVCTTTVEPVAMSHDNMPLKSTKNGQQAAPLITASQPNLNCGGGGDPVVKKEFQVPLTNPAGLLNWSEPARGTPTSSLPALDDEIEWLQASGASSTVQIRSVMLEQRMLKKFPRGLFAFAATLSTLNLSCNRLTELPEDISRFVKLAILDLTRNQLRTLPSSFSQLSHLTTLKLDYNPLGTEFSEVTIFSPPLANSLEHLSMRACKLKQVPDPAKLQTSAMPRLIHLDLADNDIDSLPAELGLCTHLKSLQLSGNTFRIPRPAVVAKGTSAILEYLRSRLPS
ncbi:Leucine-rich repeat-containing protein 40 [Paragonimus heterotremus]|uniref:Leucine-rich repeat-containing protein 40 n=1 Tax=Paragonimus heterotremus TaxID=100268 RepID=A0A8J4T6C9_9TREM|nr:Leucine-rich repeat-containing protein 40 [Paragonimus heterotremus]